MNGFKKNKNGTTKKGIRPELSNDQLGENASAETRAEEYQNATKGTKHKK